MSRIIGSDALSAPGVQGSSGGSKGPSIADQVAELERNGQYLMLYHLPAGVTADMISAVSVTDGVSSAAVPGPSRDFLIAPDSVYVNAYIPLTRPQGGAFTRTGSFIVSFTVHIDALTRITLTKAHGVMVAFTGGQGVLDVEWLLRTHPDTADESPDPETERQIEDIIAGGGYIRFVNCPRNVSYNSFSAVSVSTASGIIGRPSDYQAIAVRKHLLNAEAFVPIVSSQDGRTFRESGSFYAAFSITADALIRVIVQPSYALLYQFEEGAAEVDVSQAPEAPAKPPVLPHYLAIGGLPQVTHASNVLNVFVYNGAGIVAKCPDYTRISMVPYNGRQTALIPLVYDNNRAFNGQEFNDSGTFFVSFTVYPDAEQMITVTLENNCLIAFTEGGAYLDVSNIPPAPRNCLTITNLPWNFQYLNVADVFVHNQAGKIAKCQGYNLLEIEQTGPTATTVRIPLVYDNDEARLFAETGPYYVSFDMNVDALTRIVIAKADNILVSFTNGKGTLDASSLPQALPTPYFTIMGLPRNTVKGNFSEVFLYNAAGIIARCADYQSIIITRGSSSASAMIPLVYNNSPAEYFRDSGQFAVTFTINVDINTQIIKTRADSFAVEFTDGSGDLDLSSDYGYFSGGLVNPADLTAPVLKSGTVFEMNGAYVKLTANTAVQPADFPSARIIYVYAVKTAGNLSFVYSDTAPVWNEVKKGWYDGNRRALYKLVYLKDTAVKYAAKTLMDDPWKTFDHYPVDNAAMMNIAGSQVYSLSGASNPGPQAYTAQAGWYAVILKGAGGGGGGGIDGYSSYDALGGYGGAGGAAAELVYLDEGRSLTLFTGGGGIGSGAMRYSTTAENRQSGGGGGGGSGSFVYASGGYFLCAGGGGGGSGGGGYSFAQGGYGGAGGSAGSGGGGHHGGNYPLILGGNGNHAYGSHGGRGGGAGGGSGGSFIAAEEFYPPGRGTSYGPAATAWGYQGILLLPYETAPTDNGAAAYTQYNPPDDWKNTAGANGQGANGQVFLDTHANGNNGGAGGNNRNGLRGGGGAGGAWGVISTGAASAGGQGGAGSIVIYKL
jgi:hypothetical protein